MKMLMKEWKLCRHPFCWLVPVFGVMILIPSYPYSVCSFYICLGIFFICLTARENHDASYTITLPVSRRDMVRGRMLLCVLLEIAQILVMAAFIPVKYAIGFIPNPAGLDAGLAVIGDAFLVFAIFNMIFFPVYYRDITKPGKAFVIGSAAVFAWVFIGIASTYAVPFVRDVLDCADPANMREKALFTLGCAALFVLGTARAAIAAAKRFEQLDLSL